MKKIRKKKQNKYHLLQNVFYIYRQEFRWYPKQKTVLPLKILLELILPVLTTVLPAVAVNSITASKGIPYFLCAIGLLILTCTILGCLYEYADQWINKNHSWCRCHEFTEELVNKVLTMDYPYIEELDKQILTEKSARAIASNWVGIELMMKRSPELITNLIGLLSYATLIIVIDWRILIVLVVMCFVNLYLNRRAREYMEKHADENAALMRKQNYLYKNTIKFENLKDIILYQMSDWFRHAFEKNCSAGRKWSYQNERMWLKPAVSDIAFIALRDFAAYFILTRQVLHGHITLALFTFYLGIISGFSGWLFGLMNAWTDLLRSNIQVNDYRCIMEQPSTFSGSAGVKTFDKSKPVSIRLENVSFRYAGSEKDIITDLNLTINPGEKIALVGENGAGKTTLIKLLCGLYQPTKGTIYVNETDIRKFNRDDYMGMLSVVFQDINMFAFSIIENISGKTLEDTDISRVMKCLTKVGLKKKVDSLQWKEMMPLSQRLSKEGIELSGGEMQKLLLARALYKNAPILILDEPTAALDPIAESELYEEYYSNLIDRTSIFISHRLASTRFCDRILYFAHGAVVEEGSHEELMRRNGAYAKVYQIQSQYYTKGNAQTGDGVEYA
ncbi:MAG TPA: hypothetical protein DEG06_01200 [Lachnospiraceae bacterium]|mgnify:FL=1|jgi:ATP-binding cassette subfamily B protein|nr:hypothetical protein [Lachnospiraceae bacterium]